MVSSCLARAIASMGPWLRSHGRLDGPVTFTLTVKLQWGRGFAATEGWLIEESWDWK